MLLNDLVRSCASFDRRDTLDGVDIVGLGENVLTNGVVNVSEDGSFTFTPNLDFFGTQIFAYRAFDKTLFDRTGDLLVTQPANVTITVNSINDAPRSTTTQQTIATAEDFPREILFTDLLANLTASTLDDFRPGPDNESEQSLTIEARSGASDQGGTIEIREVFNVVDGPAGLIIQIGNVDRIPDGSTLTIDNGTEATTFEIDTNGRFDQNNRPVPFDSMGALGDATRSSILAQNLFDAIVASGIELPEISINDSTITLLTNDDDGITISSGRTLIYTPAADFAGQDQFVYRVVDDSEERGINSVNVTVTVNVGEANDPPVILNHSFTRDEDSETFNSEGSSQFPRGVLTGAVDPDGDDTALVVIVNSVDNFVDLTTSAGGSVRLRSDGHFTYTPAPDYAGLDQFSYTVRDSLFSTNTADVTINVRQVPDSPKQGAVELRLPPIVEDTDTRFLDLDNSFTDADLPFGDSLTYVIASINGAPTGTPASVTAAISGPLLSVTPLPNRSGITNIVIKALDTQGNEFEQTLVVNVNPENDPPQIVGTLNDLVVPEDSLIAPIRLTNIFGDPDGDILSFDIVSNTNQGLVATNEVELEQGADELLLVLTENASGQAVITVQADDGSGFAVTEQFTVTVEPQPDLPIAINDRYTAPLGGDLSVTERGEGLLGNDSDPDNDGFTIISFTQPQFGVVSVDTVTGALEYSNSGGVTGAIDTFNYTIQDDTLRTATATVFISIGEPILTHHNPGDGFDVSADGVLSPIDALLVVNLLNRAGASAIPVRDLPSSPPYYDVSADALVTPLDALQIVTELNRRAGLNGSIDSEYVGNVAAGQLPSPDVVSVPYYVTPEQTVSEDLEATASSSSLDPSVIAETIQNQPLESALTAIAWASDSDDETDSADSVDAALDQLLGEFKLQE